MFFTVLTFTLYLIALVFTSWYAILTHTLIWQLLAALLAIAGVYILFKCMWTWLTSIISRLRFCAKLKRWAKNNDGECTFLHSPLVSFLKVYPGEDIILKTKEKEYRIKFFPYFTKKSIVHILNEKEAAVSKQWALFFNIHHYAATSNIGVGKPLKEEMLDHNKKICLEFENTGADRVVIISPTCYRVSCVNGNHNDIVDNDYNWKNEILFWYQNSFIAFLHR